jgi:hypothetical protein
VKLTLLLGLLVIGIHVDTTSAAPAPAPERCDLVAETPYPNHPLSLPGTPLIQQMFLCENAKPASFQADLSAHPTVTAIVAKDANQPDPVAATMFQDLVPRDQVLEIHFSNEKNGDITEKASRVPQNERLLIRLKKWWSEKQVAPFVTEHVPLIYTRLLVGTAPVLVNFLFVQEPTESAIQNISMAVYAAICWSLTRYANEVDRFISQNNVRLMGAKIFINYLAFSLLTIAFGTQEQVTAWKLATPMISALAWSGLAPLFTFAADHHLMSARRIQVTRLGLATIGSIFYVVGVSTTDQLVSALGLVGEIALGATGWIAYSAVTGKQSVWKTTIARFFGFKPMQPSASTPAPEAPSASENFCTQILLQM